MNNRNKTLSIVLVIIAIAYSIFFASLPLREFSKNIYDIGCFFVIVSTLALVVHSQKSSLRGKWLKPSNIFFLAYLCVNFQFITDYRLGLKNNMSLYILFPNVLNHCFILGVVGLLSFVAGYLFLEDKERNSKQDFKVPINFIRISTILQVIVFVVFILTIDIQSFLTGEDYGNDAKPYSHVEKLLTAINAVVVVFVSMYDEHYDSVKSYVNAYPLVSRIVFVLYVLLRLFSGDRGPVMYTAFLLFYGFSFATRKKLNVWLMAAIFAVGVTIITLGGIARHLDSSLGYFERMSEAQDIFSAHGRFSESSVSPLTEELGFSVVVNETDIHAIYVDGASFHPWTYLFISLFGGIPLMPGLIKNLFHLSSLDFSSTGFANHYFFGEEVSDWSIGTTLIGDFYVQFDVWGVLIGLFLTGLLFKWLDCLIYVRKKASISFAALLLAILYSSKSIYLPRSLLLGEFSYFILGVILICVLRAMR